MSFIGSKSCHEPCAVRIQEYLEREGRAIAHDFVNLTSSEEQRIWSYFMDKTRVATGNDQPWRGLPAVTYQHFVISPDPQDKVDLETLRDLTMEWVHEFFGDELNSGKLGSYEVAVVYHNDNTLGIPHAHVIVNNTDLDTGYRLQINNAANHEIAERLQEMAAKRGLRYFDGETPSERNFGRYYTKVERAMKRDGRFVWKDDLANKVDIARRTTTNLAAFEEELERLKVSFEKRDGDYIYHHPSNPERWKVSGYRLGKAYAMQSIDKSFEIARVKQLPRSDRLRENVTRHVMKDFLENMELVAVTSHASTVEDVANALRVIDDFNIRSTSDAQRRLASLRRANDPRTADVERALETIKDASFFEGVELSKRSSTLPANRVKPKTGLSGGSGSKKNGAAGARSRAHGSGRSSTKKNAQKKKSSNRNNKGNAKR